MSDEQKTQDNSGTAAADAELTELRRKANAFDEAQADLALAGKMKEIAGDLEIDPQELIDVATEAMIKQDQEVISKATNQPVSKPPEKTVSPVRQDTPKGPSAIEIESYLKADWAEYVTEKTPEERIGLDKKAMRKFLEDNNDLVIRIARKHGLGAFETVEKVMKAEQTVAESLKNKAASDKAIASAEQTASTTTGMALAAEETDKQKKMADERRRIAPVTYSPG